MPFKISIVEPKVPLVQNGSMNLKIVAERKPGFKGADHVYPLFNPPGVGSAASATIPAGQNETLLPMNAAANAQVRKWKTAVLGVGRRRQRAGVGVVAAGDARGRAAVRDLRDGARPPASRARTTELFCKVQQTHAVRRARRR